MTTLQTVTAGAGAIPDINDNFIATSPAGIYARRAAGTSGLTWGYYGGIAFGETIANSTVALTASTTNYVVASRTTGAVSAATTTTNWNNPSGFYRLYRIVTGASTITSYTDNRDFTSGGDTSALSTSVSSLSTGLSTTTSTVGSLSTGLSTTNSGLVSLSTSASTGLSSLVSGLSTTDSSLGSLSTSTSTGLSSLSTGLSTTDSSLVSLSTSSSTGLSTATSGISSLSTGLSTTNSSLASLSTSVRQPRVQAVASASTVTPTFSDDAVKVTALAVNVTLANPSGTAVDCFGGVIRIKDNGAIRTITYGSQYRAVGVVLPSSTVAGKELYLAWIWNTEATKADIIAVGIEA